MDKFPSEGTRVRIVDHDQWTSEKVRALIGAVGTYVGSGKVQFDKKIPVWNLTYASGIEAADMEESDPDPVPLHVLKHTRERLLSIQRRMKQ